MTHEATAASNEQMVERCAAVRDSGLIYGGYLPGGDGHPAFELHPRASSAVPILIAVPHAGRSYTEDLTQRMRLPAEACLRLEDRLVDLVAKTVAHQSGATLLVARAPRAMIDLNRAPEDIDWDMVAGGPIQGFSRFGAGRRARSGLGLIPRRLPGLGELWKRRISASELQARIELVHKPYHTVLAQTLERLRDQWGAALLLDLHSMPPLGPKTDTASSPDFVVGDRYGASCAANLAAAALDHFDAAGRCAAHNRPYAGGYVLDRHSAPARGLHCVQVEICRSAYLDAALREPGEGMAEIARILAGLVLRLSEEVVAGPRAFAEAAE